MSEIQLARQPIFKVDLKVYAYELLFRRAGTSEANVIDGDHATSRVLLNTFVEMNTEQVIGEFPAFINITENMLRSGAVKILPHDRVVLEILEDVNPDEEIIKSVKELSKLGFKIALDDFVWGSEWVPLIEIADYIKIDIMAMERPEVEELVEQLKPYNCRLLAEKFESHDEFEWCRDLGFELFQGYFLSKPRKKKLVAFYANIISDCREWQKDCRGKRKARKRKVKTPKELVKFLNFKSKDEDFGIESVKPADIIGASQVWVFDTKTRFMHKYVSDIGMTVKGSTLKEFDPNQSFKKKIREAYCEQVLDDVVTGGKVKLKKSLANIAAKEVAVTGRIGNEMVIVRVMK